MRRRYVEPERGGLIQLSKSEKSLSVSLFDAEGGFIEGGFYVSVDDVKAVLEKKRKNAFLLKMPPREA